MEYGWIKFAGYSYVCKIESYNEKECEVSIGNAIIKEVPLDEIQPINGMTLPWSFKIS